MKSLGLSYFTDTNLTLLALLLFFSVFIGLTFWVFRKDQKPYFKKMSELPFDEGQKNG